MIRSTIKRGGPACGGTYGERAKERWGADLPAEVKVLSAVCDKAVAENRGVPSVAKILGVSASTIYAVIGRTYAGRLDRVLAEVAGKFMSRTVDCPAAGMAIMRDACSQNQKRKTASSANPLAAKFPAACKRCPNAFGGTNA